MLRLLFATIIVLFSTPSSALDEDEIDYQTDLIHSDVPLWGVDDETVWPKYYKDEDGSFGCTWRVKLGDWKILLHDGEEQWVRLSNYGVFHCYTMVSDFEDTLQDLKNGNGKASYFVDLGTLNLNGKKLQLWAIQKGGRPGSEYILLSREVDEGQQSTFNQLQVICPKRNQREGPSLDILSSSYCAINSKQELKKLASAMAKLPPFAKMTFEAEVAEDED